MFDRNDEILTKFTRKSAPLPPAMNIQACPWPGRNRDKSADTTIDSSWKQC